MAWGGPESISQLEETYGVRWPAEMRQGLSFPLAIEENSKEGIIGCIQLRPAKYPRQFDFGYWLGKPYWNHGYMAEALGLLCHFCFERLNADVIMGTAFTGNPASRRVMEKNGFTLEGTLRRQILKNGAWVDLWHLSILREEWLQHRTTPFSERIVPSPGSVSPV